MKMKRKFLNNGVQKKKKKKKKDNNFKVRYCGDH